jgi:hypothetical protein
LKGSYGCPFRFVDKHRLKFGVFGKKTFSKSVKNGAGEEFTLLSQTDDTRADNWWPDTVYLVHALSKGDLSTFRAAVEMISDDKAPVLMTGAGSVTNELYTRLEYLGYTQRDEDTVPEEFRQTLQAYTVTEYGALHIPDFVVAQQMQMEHLEGRREPLEKFCNKFSEMREHHSGLSLELLQTIRLFFSDPENDIEAPSSSHNLFRLYEILGIVRYSDDDLVYPTLFGAANAPFLFDLILQEQSGTTLH